VSRLVLVRFADSSNPANAGFSPERDPKLAAAWFDQGVVDKVGDN